MTTPPDGSGPASTYHFTRWLFLRLLAIVWLIAFVSLWVQIDGLMGSDGIMPAADQLEWRQQSMGDDAYWRLPTLVWIDHSDGFLHFLCGFGALLSLLLLAGIAPIPVLFLLWVVYLSLFNVGTPFLSFQWDILLLETGLLAMFFAPRRLLPARPHAEPRPWGPGLWLLRLLLFKLMFLSGVTKLVSLDETWWNLTALDYHYYTQPLSLWTAWYAHHLPGWFQKLSVILMYAAEIGAPFLIFMHRGFRLAGCAGMVALMALIAATGNYAYFNLLAVVLCVTLLDDRFLLRFVPSRVRHVVEGELPERIADVKRTWWNRLWDRRPARVAWLLRRGVPAAVVFSLLLASGMTMVREIVRTRPRGQIGGWAGRVFDWGDRYVLSWGQSWVLDRTDPFHSISGYGLFRSMTTRRPELILEGSDDGVIWKEYEFRWKPGDPSRRPRLVAPHQPRLDWQMWFAALNPRGNSYWLDRLAVHILRGTPAVLDLLGPNPFPDAPPRWLRIAFYDYTFTTPDERRSTGNWWKRQRQGVARPMSLVDFGQAPRSALRPGAE